VRTESGNQEATRESVKGAGAAGLSKEGTQEKSRSREALQTWNAQQTRIDDEPADNASFRKKEG
jgi:hypothetical protein